MESIINNYRMIEEVKERQLNEVQNEQSLKAMTGWLKLSDVQA